MPKTQLQAERAYDKVQEKARNQAARNPGKLTGAMKRAHNLEQKYPKLGVA